MNKPKRPCGIYNLFYQLERELLIQHPDSSFDQLHHHPKAPYDYEKGDQQFIPAKEAGDADHRPPRYRHLVLACDWFKSGRRIRKHCKSKANLPENLGFDGLNKVISEKWKTVDEETKRYLKVISDQEWVLYRKEMRAYKRIQEELTKIMTAKAGEAKGEDRKILVKMMKREGNKSHASKEIATMDNISGSTASKCKKQLLSQGDFPVGDLSSSFLGGEGPPTPPVSCFVDPKEESPSNSDAASPFIPLRARNDTNVSEQRRSGHAHSKTRYVQWPSVDQSGLHQITTLSSHRDLDNIGAHFPGNVPAKRFRAQIGTAHYQQPYQIKHNWIRSKISNPNSLFPVPDKTVPSQNLIDSLNNRLLMSWNKGSAFPQTQNRPVDAYNDNNGFSWHDVISDSDGSEQYNDDFPSFHPVPEDILSRQTFSERLEFLSQMDNQIDGLLHDFSQLEQSTSLFDHASR